MKTTLTLFADNSQIKYIQQSRFNILTNCEIHFSALYYGDRLNKASILQSYL